MSERLASLQERRLSGTGAVESVADWDSLRDLIDGAECHVQRYWSAWSELEQEAHTRRERNSSRSLGIALVRKTANQLMYERRYFRLTLKQGQS